MEFPIIYDIIHNNEPKVIFWFVIILILMLYLIDNLFLVIIFYSIIIYYIHTYIHINQTNEHYEIENKYNEIKLTDENIKKYKNIINFLYKLKEYKKYNISRFSEIEHLIYKFMDMYEQIKNNNMDIQTNYNTLTDIQYQIIKTVHTFTLHIYNKEHNKNIKELTNEIFDILKNYIDEIYDLYHKELIKDGISHKTKLINNSLIKPSNFLDNNNIFEKSNLSKFKISMIL